MPRVMEALPIDRQADVPPEYTSALPTLEKPKEPQQRALFLIAEQPLEELSERERQRLFPADELGIPLSIDIPQSYRNELGRLDSARYRLDDHHRFAPKKFLIHRYGDLGKILRYCCLQNVPREVHDDFNASFDKPLLPVSQTAKFGAILLSVARYFPAEAINVTDGEPFRRELSPAERQRIWGNNEIRPQQGGKIQREILKYVAKQDLSGVDESVIEEFVTTPYDDARIRTGKKLFRIAAEVAVGPIERRYQEAWDGGLLPRLDVRADRSRRPQDMIQSRAAPKSPGKFITRHIVRNEYVMKSALNMLESNLQVRNAA
jgi:hypothetical protein